MVKMNNILPNPECQLLGGLIRNTHSGFKPLEIANPSVLHPRLLCFLRISRMIVMVVVIIPNPCVLQGLKKADKTLHRSRHLVGDGDFHEQAGGGHDHIQGCDGHGDGGGDE